MILENRSMLHKYGKGTMMTFPLEFTEVTEEQKEWDDQYLMPMEAKKIQLEVMEMCDQMEYDGSRMFDEYMDRTMLLSMADKIYDKMNYQEKEDCPKQERKLHQMIVILIGGEIYHRRCRYRTKKNMFRS